MPRPDPWRVAHQRAALTGRPLRRLARVCAAVLWAILLACATSQVTAAESAPRFTPSRSELAAFTGRYEAEGGAALTVVFGARQDLRGFGSGGAETVSLRAAGPDTFEIASQPGGTATFQRTDDHVSGLVLRRDERVTTFRRGDDPHTAVEVRYETDVPLVATLYKPRGEGPFPAAIVVHGSGTSDRDSAWYWRTTEVLLAAGYAVLLPDKRGSGRSGGDWREVGFDRLAEDALAGWRALVREPDIRADVVGLVGVSQGGWIAPIAARREEGVAFVVNLVGSAVSPREQVTLEIENTLRAEGVPEQGIEAILRLQDLGFAYIATGEGAAEYLAAYDALLKTPLASAARELPRDLQSWEMRWWKRVHDFEPTREWNAVCDRPVFVAYGADDERDNVPVTASVQRLTDPAAGAAPGCRRKVVVYPGVGHSLSAGNDFHPQFRSDFTAWLRAVAFGAARDEHHHLRPEQETRSGACAEHQ